jgi:5-methylthioribose kinase
MPEYFLDIEQPDQLVAYLRETGRVARDEVVHPRVLTGGVSNKTVLVERPSGEAWVLKQALPKLRVAVDWFSDPARIGREALGLRYLEKLAPPGATTPLVFEDPAHHLLAMQAVPQPHENWKTMLMRGDVNKSHVEQFAGLLGAIHRRGAESAEPLAELFGDRRFFESLRVEPYYAYAATQVPSASGFLRDLIDATRSRRLTLVHGDFSPKNVLVYQGRLVLLDHEVIHWGDPAFDLGFALTHLLSKAHHCSAHAQQFAEAVLWFRETYRAAVGPVYWTDNLEAFAVHHTLGCLLARVAGRSPLEYLDHQERERQRDVVVRLMAVAPPKIEDLLRLFLWGIGPHAPNKKSFRP